MLTSEDWHNRFRQQARWTESIRKHLFSQLPVESEQNVLEVGCGTGAVLADLPLPAAVKRCGIDLKWDWLKLAQSYAPSASLAAADALSLPFPDHHFDICLCHYFLLWVSRPAAALKEMARVTKPGGAVMLLAEPDYSGRIDYPEPLARVGFAQAEAIRRQGADPDMGRKIDGLMHAAGLQNIVTGVLGGEWNQPPAPEALAAEWSMLENDLRGQFAPIELKQLQSLEQRAWAQGSRILYVPTFYSVGQVS